MEIWFKKLGLERTINGVGKLCRKENPIEKIEKTVKNQSGTATCEQKTTSEKTNFCSNTVISLN